MDYIAEPLRHLAVPLAELKTDPRNARKHDARNLEAVRLSLSRFGQRLPLVVQRQGMIVRAGNARLEAARQLGWSHVAAVVIDETDLEAAAFGIADNRSAELAEWNDAALATLLREIREESPDALSATGFMHEEVDRLLEQTFEELAPAADEAVVAPAPQQPRTQPGDLWQLGEHRLLCGDARSLPDLARLLGSQLADCLWTDPPYGVSYVGGTKDHLTIQNDDAAGLPDLLRAAFSAVDHALRPGAPIYIAHPAGPLSVQFGQAVLAVGWLWHVTLVWVKNALVLGHGDYHYKHEPLIVATKAGGQVIYGWKRGEARPWHGDRGECSIIEVPRPRSSEEHPTMKPAELVMRCLRNSTKRGDVVLDPFCGSGSTLLACQNLGRRCYGVELDPGYCDVILDRFERQTGSQAQRVAV